MYAHRWAVLIIIQTKAKDRYNSSVQQEICNIATGKRNVNDKEI